MNSPNQEDLISTKSDDTVVRHKLLDRLYHWTMAVSVIVLMGTAFLPIIGIKFPWVTIHWIAGVVLSVLILFHIIRAVFWQDRLQMSLGRADFKRALQAIKWVLRSRRKAPDLPGKYPLLQKLYHHIIAVLVLALIGTGGFMLAKIDTPFWQRNPYMLSADSWGWIYVIHDLTALAVLSMFIIHIYFAIRPEKLWITRSMLLGWIFRRDYNKHHDSKLWNPDVK